MPSINRTELAAGVKAGLPIALGYLPIAVAFGLLAKSQGVPNSIGMLMSLLIYAGASQFIGINLLVLGTSFGEIVIATFLLNLRHFLMSAALSQKLEGTLPKSWRAVLAFGVTDETFAVNALQTKEFLSPYFVLGLHTVAFAAWNAGTWLGLFFAAGLPEIIKASMGIALYAMFIGLLVPHIKSSRPAFTVALLAILLNSLLVWSADILGLSGGFSIILATVLGAAAGAFLYREDNPA